jgi:hypothetical protein
MGSLATGLSEIRQQFGKRICSLGSARSPKNLIRTSNKKSLTRKNTKTAAEKSFAPDYLKLERCPRPAKYSDQSSAAEIGP